MALAGFIGLALYFASTPSLESYTNSTDTDTTNTSTANTSTQHWIWQAKDLTTLNLNDSNGLVIMQGEYKQQGEQVVFGKKGLAPYPIKSSKELPIRLLIRAYQLPPIKALSAQINYLVYNWKMAGVTIKGVQIDYDAPASKLLDYRDYIQALDQQLKPKHGAKFISITGLSSWLADNIKALNQFNQSIEYVAIQFYQYHRPVPRAEQYAQRLKQLSLPYKIGITTAPQFTTIKFATNQHYTGKLIFSNVSNVKGYLWTNLSYPPLLR